MMLGIGVKRKSVGLGDKLLGLSWGECRQLLKNHNGDVGNNVMVGLATREGGRFSS